MVIDSVDWDTILFRKTLKATTLPYARRRLQNTLKIWRLVSRVFVVVPTFHSPFRSFQHLLKEEYLDEEYSRAVHMKCREHALHYFDAAVVLGSETIRQTFRDDLERKLNDYHDNFSNRVKCLEVT